MFVTPGLGDNSYLLASGGEAVLVDPQRDAGRFLVAAEARGWRVRGVLETHVHNDYVTGALEVADATGATLHAPARGGYAFPHHGLAEGDEVEVGNLLVRALETPGHTPEHLCYLVLGADGGGAAGGEPEAVFTGGSLMVGSAGRTDLLGEDRAEELTRAQFHSLGRLAGLPASVAVLPTHGAGSFCGSAGAAGPRRSTMGAERATNTALAERNVDGFVRQRLSGLLEYPAYYRFMAPINRAGPPLLRALTAPAALGPDGLRGSVREGAWVIDGRDREPYAEAHVPGSVNIELDDSFSTYVGWIVPWGTPVVLVVPEERGALEEACTQLHRIGVDRIVGYLAGGFAAWTQDGGAVGSYPTAALEDLCRATRGSQPPEVLDVRQPGEWEEGTIPGSRTIFVGDLRDRVREVPAGEEVWTICKSGHRAAIAASLLDRAGIPVRLVRDRGVPDWLATCGST